MIALLAVMALAQPVPSPIPDATTARRGVINTQTQAFSGRKFFDGGVTADVFAPRRVGVQNLYVSASTGSDANDCLTMGTACASISAAVARVPRRIDWVPWAINVDGGAYPENVVLSGLTVTGAEDGGLNSLTIQGAMTAPTLTTGTTSGNMTSYATRTGALPYIVTDTGQSWTTDELRGHWLHVGSGFSPIIGNSATTISLSQSVSGGASVAYTIERPAAQVGGRLIIEGLNGEGTISLSQLQFTTSGTTPAALWQYNRAGTVAATRSRFTAANAMALQTQDNSARLSVVQGVLETNGPTTTCGVDFQNAQRVALGAYYRGATGGGVCINGVHDFNFTGYWEAAMPAGYPIFSVQSGTAVKGTSAGLILRCLTQQTGVGLWAWSVGYTRGAAGSFGLQNLGVVDCATGVAVDTPLVLLTESATIVDAGVGFETMFGGRIAFRSPDPTLTRVNNELVLDGTNFGQTFTYSAFNVSPYMLFSLRSGSAFQGGMP